MTKNVSFQNRELDLCLISRHFKGLPQTQKVKDVVEHKPSPTDVSGVRQFFGVINELAKFMPNLFEVTEPLLKMLQNKNNWM